MSETPEVAGQLKAVIVNGTTHPVTPFTLGELAFMSKEYGVRRARDIDLEDTLHAMAFLHVLLKRSDPTTPRSTIEALDDFDLVMGDDPAGDIGDPT